MKIAMVQLNIKWESKKANLERAETFIATASKNLCHIVVFPEMFNTGFSMNVSKIAEDENGKTASKLSHWSKKYKISIIAGFPAKAKGIEKGLNMAVVFNKDGLLIAKYIKIYPFSFSGEDKYYLPGNSPVVFNLLGMSSSVFICYDLRFPEVFRLIAKKVQVIYVIANWPNPRKKHWELLLKARAVENQCFIIGVNRTGSDGNGLYYSGGSHIFDPLGNDLCSAGKNNELIMAEIDPEQVDKIRSNFPFLEDMQ